MEKVKAIANKYWFIVVPLAIFGGWLVWKTYVQPRLMPAAAE